MPCCAPSARTPPIVLRDVAVTIDLPPLVSQAEDGRQMGSTNTPTLPLPPDFLARIDENNSYSLCRSPSPPFLRDSHLPRLENINCVLSLLLFLVGFSLYLWLPPVCLFFWFFLSVLSLAKVCVTVSARKKVIPLVSLSFLRYFLSLLSFISIVHRRKGIR